MMGFGFVVSRFGLFLREIAATHGTEVVPRGVPWSLWTGLSLACLGVITVAASLLRFHAITKSIERHQVGAPAGSGWVYAIGAGVIVAGVTISILLVATR